MTMQLRPIDNGGLPSFLPAPTPGGTTCHADRTRSRSLTKIAISLLLMSQLVGRIPGFIFVPPHPVFFGTSLVLPPTSSSAVKNQEKPRDRVPHTPKLPSLSLLLMEQLVASYGLFSSHHFQPFYFAGFFFVPPPPHRFSFASPSHTTKKILTDHNFPCWCKLFLVMSLCERINHDQFLNIKCKLINLTLNCSITLIRKQNNRF